MKSYERNIGYLGLDDNKIKHYVSSSIKCVGEIYTFSNTGPHKLSYFLNRCQYDHHYWLDKLARYCQACHL